MKIATWCSPLPLITSIPHRHTGRRCRFIRAKDSSQSSGMTHKLLTPHTGCVIALPTALLWSVFALLSYMDEMALNATRKNRARREATLKELKVYSRLFIQAKSALIKSWFDNDVFDLVDIRKFKPKNFVTGRWVLTVKRDRDGKFQKCKARWVLRGFQDRQKDAQQTDSPTSTRPGLRLLCQNVASNGWSIRHIDLQTAFLQG